jgi:1-phosphofructokinase
MIITVTLNPSVDIFYTARKLMPGALNRADQAVIMPGGKGINVSRTLFEMGSSSRALLFSGGRTGELMDKLLMGEDIHFETVRCGGDTRLNTKLADVYFGSFTEINAPGAPVTMEEFEKMRKALRDTIQQGDHVVLSGSLPPGLAEHMYAILLSDAGEAGAGTVVDTSGEPLRKALEAGPYLVKINEDELDELAGEAAGDVKGIARQAARLIRRYGVGVVIVTLGARGAVYCDRAQSLFCPAPAAEARYQNAAGDSFLAGFLLGMEKAMEAEECLKMATACAVARISGAPGEKIRKDAVKEIFSRLSVRKIEK